MKISELIKTAVVLSVSITLAASVPIEAESFSDMSYFEDMPALAPSEMFASGAVFDIYRQYRDEFKEVFDSGDPMLIWGVFAQAYDMYLEHLDENDFFGMIDVNVDDTDPMEWNTDIFNLSEGDTAALLFMPVKNNDTIAARIVGIVTSDKEDGFYYCMLNADENITSDVKRNMSLAGVKYIGEVKGRGFELMNSFLECIKDDFYGDASHENS